MIKSLIPNNYKSVFCICYDFEFGINMYTNIYINKNGSISIYYDLDKNQPVTLNNINYVMNLKIYNINDFIINDNYIINNNIKLIFQNIIELHSVIKTCLFFQSYGELLNLSEDLTYLLNNIDLNMNMNFYSLGRKEKEKILYNFTNEYQIFVNKFLKLVNCQDINYFYSIEFTLTSLN